jgi:hypothetical protein
MHAQDLLPTLRRCGRLKRAERSLAHQLQRRLAAVGTARLESDPPYRRLWAARSRVQVELDRAESALNLRFQGGVQRRDVAAPALKERT